MVRPHRLVNPHEVGGWAGVNERGNSTPAYASGGIDWQARYRARGGAGYRKRSSGGDV